ncbi:hypothetical protein EYF80_019788 [Liparis tanakae]|uniref:Uncharacterized protein n=1 Tax=Liparis tanakae TaxID=230148 RepID=A0A4Z2HX55_9TELE|nr:hypothetical protein EYF80_019788 [Liparis tanakae]
MADEGVMPTPLGSRCIFFHSHLQQFPSLACLLRPPRCSVEWFSIHHLKGFWRARFQSRIAYLRDVRRDELQALHSGEDERADGERVHV